MGFAIDNSEAAGEIVQVLTEALTLDETPIPTKIARLFLVSDILHNSTAAVRNAHAYRSLYVSFVLSFFLSLFLFLCFFYCFSLVLVLAFALADLARLEQVSETVAKRVRELQHGAAQRVRAYVGRAAEGAGDARPARVGSLERLPAAFPDHPPRMYNTSVREIRDATNSPHDTRHRKPFFGRRRRKRRSAPRCAKVARKTMAKRTSTVSRVRLPFFLPCMQSLTVRVCVCLFCVVSHRGRVQIGH
jgi:hypothetical protein